MRGGSKKTVFFGTKDQQQKARVFTRFFQKKISKGENFMTVTIQSPISLQDAISSALPTSEIQLHVLSEKNALVDVNVNVAIIAMANKLFNDAISFTEFKPEFSAPNFQLFTLENSYSELCKYLGSFALKSEKEQNRNELSSVISNFRKKLRSVHTFYKLTQKETVSIASFEKIIGEHKEITNSQKEKLSLLANKINEDFKPFKNVTINNYEEASKLTAIVHDEQLETQELYQKLQEIEGEISAATAELKKIAEYKIAFFNKNAKDEQLATDIVECSPDDLQHMKTLTQPEAIKALIKCSKIYIEYMKEKNDRELAAKQKTGGFLSYFGL